METEGLHGCYIEIPVVQELNKAPSKKEIKKKLTYLQYK